MHLTAAELGQLFEGEAAVVVLVGQNGECHEHFVAVETWVLAAEITYLGVLYRLDQRLGDKLQTMVDAGKMLGDVEKQGGAASQEFAGVGADDGAVL